MAKSESKSAVAGKGAKRKPKLGQNFLTDHSAAQRIVEALGDISNRTVIEIGPGRGMLTDLLVRRARKVIGIELDHILAAQMRMRYATLQNVEILESDFVTVEWRSMVGRRPGPLHDLRPTQPETVDIVGNIPYYVTSDIVLRILREHAHIGRAVIMVQREVADRIAAEPGSRDYGLLSATVQLFARADKLFTLPPGAFDPPPEVHSSVVRLDHGAARGGIAGRSGSVRGNAEGCVCAEAEDAGQQPQGQLWRKGIAAVKAAGVKPDARAEALPLEKMAAIFRALQQA